MSNKEIEILDEQIIYQQGSFRKIRRWLRGIQPHLGIIINGLTGLETLQETNIIKPIHTFTVLTENVSDTNTEEYCVPQVLPLPPLDDLQLQKHQQSELQREAA